MTNNLDLARECGATPFTPPPLRAVRGVSFAFDQLDAFATRVRAEAVASAEPAPGVQSESLRLASIWSCTGKNMELAEIMQRGDEMARELRHQHAHIAEIEGQRNELVDTVCGLQAELERIKKIEGENSTDSWLELSDDDKRTWFALAVQKGRERLKRVIELEDQLEAIGAGGVSALIPGRPAD